MLDVALEYGLIGSNPARQRRRRLKANRPGRAYLDSADQITALLAAAGGLDAKARVDRKHVARRPLLATLVFAGLRIGELLDCGGATSISRQAGSLRKRQDPGGGPEDKDSSGASRGARVVQARRSPHRARFLRLRHFEQSTSVFRQRRSRMLNRSVQVANEHVQSREETPLPALDAARAAAQLCLAAVRDR